MTTQVNTYGDISPRVAVKSSKRLLRVAQPKLVTQRFGQPEVQEGNSGSQRKWRRYHPFPVTTAPLAEGISPNGVRIVFTDYQVVMQQYGDVVYITDRVADTHEDPLLKIMSERCGQQYAQVIELVTIDVLKSCTNRFFAGSVGARGSVVAKVTRADIRNVTRALDRNQAMTISSVIAPGEKVATQPVEASFFAMGHTDLGPDIRGITGFVPSVNYSQPGKTMECEIGKVDNIRFILTTNFTPWVASGGSSSTMLNNGMPPDGSEACDVYPLIIVGQDAYGVVRLQGREAVSMYVLNPNVARGGDPIGQRGSIGWKTYYAAVILADPWMAVLEVACTANPE